MVVAGGGNAALVAAITARGAGKSVLLLEAAPPHMRGGNTRHTRDIRIAHDAPSQFVSGAYPVAELLEDLTGVGSPANPELARRVCEESIGIADWMYQRGVRWQPPLRGTLSLSRTNLFFLGGGTAVVNALYHSAEHLGVAIAYNARVVDLLLDDRSAHGVVVESADGPLSIQARSVVVASGGFEANIEWLKRYWGDAAENYLIRGTPFNDGRMLAKLMEVGVTTAGDPKGFHATCIDARSPRFDGGIATRLDAVPFSIAVDRDGRRFADEGLDIWPKRYASWGRIIAERPGQIIYSVCDSRARPHFMPSMYPAYVADSIRELAIQIGVDPDRLSATVTEFNASVEDASRFDPSRLDHCGTRGLEPPKSNWALPIIAPPFYSYPIRPGITFTYMGVAVDEHARVLDQRGVAYDSLFAAGEVMSGNILSSGYLAGFGLTIGHVFGRIAGAEAAHAAH